MISLFKRLFMRKKSHKEMYYIVCMNESRTMLDVYKLEENKIEDVMSLANDLRLGGHFVIFYGTVNRKIVSNQSVYAVEEEGNCFPTIQHQNPLSSIYNLGEGFKCKDKGNN